ncbi:cytosolic phospholipase A2 gamma [Rhynchocyon petersi]
MDSPDVFIKTRLQEGEKKSVEKRKEKVLKALEKLNIDAKKAPVISMLGSGGGLRAHIACIGVLSEMKQQNLLDAVTYVSGVSGSTWALSSFYANNGDTKVTEDELKERFNENEWGMFTNLSKTVEASKLENYSLTDFWAYLVVSKQTRELQDSCLSSMTKVVEEGTLPYPIFAAIDDDLNSAWKKTKTRKSWFEFTPHHAGYPALGAYIPTTHFGSQFKKGKLVKPRPERDVSFLKAPGLLDFMHFARKTGSCLKNWEWGTTFNYLYQHDGIEDKFMRDREFFHLVDAGFALNCSYPLVLPPIRDADLILSFDFSSGDPFETIKITVDYCNKNGIAFPPVKEADLQEWTKAPSSCYIFKGENGPTVMHFPLFNTDSCGSEIDKWAEEYDTFQLSGNYTKDMVTRLLEVSKNNVRHNKDNIFREIENLSRIEFALAILTGPIISDQLKLSFHGILQEEGSEERKIVKCTLKIPQENLDLEQ